MFRSMTGFGRAELDTLLARYTIEIQSINRKHLDIFVSLPKELMRFETDFRKWISQALTRGQISLKLHVAYKDQTPLTIQPQLPLAAQVKDAVEKINREFNLHAEPVDAFQLIRACPSILAYEDDWQDEEGYREEVHQVFNTAIEKLMAMKETEGTVLAKEINHRLTYLRELIKEIALLTPDATSKQRQKLSQRLEELLPGVIENEERVLREVILYAEKVDVAEELTRFNAHLDQLGECTYAKDPAIGKTFEFVLQELLRETNTIGSKASDLNITRKVVAIKAEIEKMREQIQNVE